MIYGYCRVSTTKQVISRQVENICKSYPDAVIYSENFTGTTTDRPQWQKLLKVIKTGDTIVFDSVSRMSRNAAEGIETYFSLYDAGIELIFLNESYINTATYKQALTKGIESTGNEIADIYIEATNKVLKILATQQIQQAFEQAEKEVKDLQKRTSQGMKAKGAGNKIKQARQGRTFETPKAKKIKSAILKHCKEFGGTLKDKEIIQMLKGELGNCTEPTYYRYKKALIEQSGQITGQMKLNS